MSHCYYTTMDKQSFNIDTETQEHVQLFQKTNSMGWKGGRTMDVLIESGHVDVSSTVMAHPKILPLALTIALEWP